MVRTDDPVKDFENHDTEQQSELDKLPLCIYCGEPIQQDKAFYYNDQWCCKECEPDFWNDIREDFLEGVDEDG